VIRSKIPVTKKEFGDNYIAVGPLNESFIRTEVEVKEPDIGALRRAIHAMRNCGINVSFLFYKKNIETVRLFNFKIISPLKR